MVPTDRPPTSRETAYLSATCPFSPCQYVLFPQSYHFTPVSKSLCTRSEVIYDSFLSQFRGVK